MAALRDHVRLLEGLSEIQRAIARRAPLDDVVEAVVDLTAQLLGDKLAVLFLRDGDELVVAACRGIEDDRLAAISVVAQRAVRDGRLVVAEEHQAVPVHESGEVVGALLVSSGKLELLEAIAQHVSLALTDAKTVNAMVHQALHDGLTGLPNRALFLDRLEHALARAARGGSDVAVLFLDLDRFKAINDSLGHAAGDELLCTVASRIASCMRAADTAARLGGDEFAVLLEDVVSRREALRVAERIIEALSEPVVLAEREMTVGTSIGIAIGRAGAEDLLRQADVAMYRAKAQGKGSYALFEEGMQAEVVERRELESDLGGALERGELELFFQPILTLASGELAGHEALLRWNHPERGLLGPASFVPVAEETGLIAPIGSFVLRAACRQAAEWLAAGHGLLAMHVNLSGRQLESPRLVDELSAILRETGLPAGRLVLEIAETVLMHDTETTIERLRALRALGVRLAVDDFGTGHSSLRFLNRFPLDVLKMAKPFVDGLEAHTEDPALARAIVDLGAHLGLTIVAEGIEQSAQLAQLRRLGCPLGQGYWFARPMPAGEATAQMAGPASAAA